MTSTHAQGKKSPAIPGIQGLDYVELYVSNALQAAHYYRTAFGFAPLARAGLETGLRDQMSILLQQGESYLILTSPLGNEGPVAEYVLRHGDGVKDIAFRVEHAQQAFDASLRWGARPLLEPTKFDDEHGVIVKATVAAYGDVVHSFVQRDGAPASFLPAYQKIQAPATPWTGLSDIDHFAISLPQGEVERWADFYSQVFGFHQIHEENIATEHSAMRSRAVQDATERLKFVLIEPVPGKRKSQIEEFLKFHQGPGVQHIALLSSDIIESIHTLKAKGVGFVSTTPGSYYDLLPERVGSISEDIAALREANILVDRDEWGYLLQIFSLPVQSRPTFFIEIIQRREARGFGSGNIQALFKALEYEQARRGNL